MQHRLIWFRDDLRTQDNSALVAALKDDRPIRLSAVFLTANDDWSRFGYGANRLFYTEQVLRSLAKELSLLSIDFQVVILRSYLEQVKWLVEYCQTEEVTDLFFNQEYQVNERQRDLDVVDLVQSNIKIHEFADRIMLQAGDVLTKENNNYTVFTPFKKRWLDRIKEVSYAPFTLPSHHAKPSPIAQWAPLCNAPESDLSSYATSETEAIIRLDEFIENGLFHYESTRNSPSLSGTSRLSPYLARGLISPRQCVARAEAFLDRPIWDFPVEAFSWINEIIWRDFYQHLLVGFPRLSMNKAFRANTESICWINNEADITAWKNGSTGIPIVDAGMRELTETGWMHNRVRMVVAQFLTKNLLCDWRIGESYFMRYLVDSDLGANNGGWQWSASTGTDAAPYFRVFNPVSQSQTHDPDGSYLAKWIPSLTALEAAKRHAPWTSNVNINYPPPIVDLKTSRQRAIDAFKDLRK